MLLPSHLSSLIPVYLRLSTLSCSTKNRSRRNHTICSSFHLTRRHLFSEQFVTRNMLAHPFCLRQFASFSDANNLYFLFELCSNGDLMDVLVCIGQAAEMNCVALWRWCLKADHTC